MNGNYRLLWRMAVCVLFLSAVSPDAGAEDEEPATVSETVDVSAAVKDFLSKTIGHPREERLALARATIESTDAALEKQPMKAEQRLLQVAALGAAARASSLGQSLKERYGSRSKMAVNDLLSIAPEEPWALFFAGLWNMEVDRRGGVLGSALLGGSFEAGEKLVAQALEKRPEEPSFHFAHAVVLVSTDAKKYVAQVRELLTTTRNLIEKNPGAHPLNAVMEAQAKELTLKLDQEDYEQAQKLALDMM